MIGCALALALFAPSWSWAQAPEEPEGSAKAEDAGAEDSGAEDSHAELEARLAALEAEVRTLRKQVQKQARERARDKRRARKAEPAVEAEQRGVYLEGYLQADASLYRASSKEDIDPSTGEPLNRETFLLRRARLRAGIERGIVGGYVEFDGNTVRGPSARIVAGELSLGWPPLGHESSWGVRASMGLMKIPFGYEVPEENLAELFLERTTAAEAIFPGNYDLGVKLTAEYMGVSLTLAALNGAPSGEQQFEARDPTESYDLLARLAARVSPIAWLELQGGISALWGHGLSPGARPTKDSLVWRDFNENGTVEITEIQVIPGQPGTASETFEHFATGGHAVASFEIPWLGRLMLLGEVIFAQNMDRALYIADPVTRARDVRELGWLAGARQEITPWAEIGARYDHYQPDFDATEQQVALVPLDTSLSTLAVTAAGRWKPARIIFEYDRRLNALGRTSSGQPTNRRDDSFTIRGEVTF